jgi:uncharacterized protein (DUF58 family)
LEEAYLDVADRLNSRQFFIAVKRLADSLSYGVEKSAFLGSGVEYVQSRPYQWGDPIRSVDWRITARTGKVHVKEYETPKRMATWLLIDASASMTIASGRRSKYAAAMHIAGGLAFACLDRVSPVGVLAVGGPEYRFAPSLSQASILQWLHRFRRHRFDQPTAVGRRIAELAPMLSNRALVIVLSDLHDPQALAALKLLGQKHDCVLLHFVDPAEAGVAGAGFLRAVEAETGVEFVVQSRRAKIDADAVAREVRRGRVDYLRIDVDRPFAAKLRHFFRSRHLLGRGAR